MSAPSSYLVQVVKRNNGKFALKVGGQGKMIKGDLKTMQELVSAAGLMLTAVAAAEKAQARLAPLSIAKRQA